MKKEDILKIIETNKSMPYNDLRTHAMAAGIGVDDFNNAWNEHLENTKKTPAMKIWEKIYTVLLVIYTVAGLEIGYFNIVINLQNKILAGNLGKLAILTTLILILHLISHFTGSKGSIFTTTKLSVFIVTMFYLTYLITKLNTPFVQIFLLFGGVILAFITFYTIMKVYNMNIIRTIILIILSGLVMSLVIQFTIGLITFKNYYVVNPNIKDLKMESAVDIAINE